MKSRIRYAKRRILEGSQIREQTLYNSAEYFNNHLLRRKVPLVKAQHVETFFRDQTGMLYVTFSQGNAINKLR